MRDATGDTHGGVSPGRAREDPHGSNLNICLTLKEFYSVLFYNK